LSLFSKMLIFYLVVAIGLYSFGVGTPFTAFLSGEEDLLSFIGDSGTGFIINLGVAVAAAGIAASLLQASSLIPVLLLAAFASFFLTFLTYPQSLIEAVGTPEELRLLLNGVFVLFNLLFVIGLVSFLFGRND